MKRRKDIRRRRDETADICDGQWLRETASDDEEKAVFLERMERLVPWGEFCALIEPYYPKAGNGRPPVGLERMPRMYF
jgi:hypothetical protein